VQVLGDDDVRLSAPKLVKPAVKAQKNDIADAGAVVAAGARAISPSPCLPVR